VVRELTRYRKTLVQSRADEANRLQKTLEGANLKLASVATDVLGMSGRAMFAALIEGERTPRSWPTWPVESSEPSCLSCARRSSDVSSHTTSC
jgi:hypothetical protein